MLRVLMGSPIRQDPEILQHFLWSIDHLVLPPDVSMDCYFVDDNDDDRSRELLTLFRPKNARDVTVVPVPPSGIRSPYVKDDQTHQWTEDLAQRVGAFKDHIFDRAMRLGYDYVFLADSDLILHPNTLAQLLSSGRDIISEIFWTKWQPDSIALPNVWLKDQYTLFDSTPGETVAPAEQYQRIMEFLNMLKRPGVYRVGGLGACTLISKSALMKGVNFSRVRNLSLLGEDRHFCVRAEALGIPLYVDTHYPALHLYRKSDLSELVGSQGQDADPPQHPAVSTSSRAR